MNNGIINKIKKIRWKVKWKIEYFFESRNQKRINAEILPNGKKAILIPHADDEWIGCSQIIKNESDCILINMDMSGNDNTKLHKKRYNELLKLSKSFNKEMITISKDKSNTLAKILENKKILYVCVPYCIDWHDEHIKVMQILEQALRISKNDINVIMYQVSLPIYCNNVTHYIPMTKEEWRLKWKTFSAIYKTQKRFPSYRFSMNERINGKNVNRYATEFYVIKTAKDWTENYSKYILTQEERKEILKNISSISKTRKMLKNKRYF